MTRIKICGVTTPEDARLAADLGASAIGLVFWPGSPRAVTRERGRAIVAALPPFVAAVGVFVNQPAREVAAIARHVGLSAVQLHGDETADDYMGIAPHTIKAVAVIGPAAIDAAARVPSAATILLDAHDPRKRGGTGRAIDWSIAAQVARRRPTVLSGGLRADNIADAITVVRPAAVDVSSGVESAPGRKDPARLRAFFAAVGSL